MMDEIYILDHRNFVKDGWHIEMIDANNHFYFEHEYSYSKVVLKMVPLLLNTTKTNT